MLLMAAKCLDAITGGAMREQLRTMRSAAHVIAALSEYAEIDSIGFAADAVTEAVAALERAMLDAGDVAVSPSNALHVQRAVYDIVSSCRLRGGAA